jgi:hypothetical protein
MQGRLIAAAACVVVILFAPACGGNRDAGSGAVSQVLAADVEPEPTRIPQIPGSWMDELAYARQGATAQLSCMDANGDGRLDAADGDEFVTVDTPLTRQIRCTGEDHPIEVFSSLPTDLPHYGCGDWPAPLLVVAVGGGGTDLRDRTLGESPGLIGTVNDLQAEASALGISSSVLLTAAAIGAADMPQLAMERWLEGALAARLQAMPCLRAVLLGHSHGGVTVSSVTAALEPRFGARIAGVMVDRTLALYDHGTSDYPASVPLLNVFQTNEGWHGVPLDAPNIENLDESRATAPGDGIAAPVEVTHLTLDDSPGAREAILGWVTRWLDRSEGGEGRGDALSGGPAMPAGAGSRRHEGG